jgi:hypothetical protein
MVVIYSLMEPFGMSIGIILSLSVRGGSSEVLNAILTSIAAGTFLYVAVGTATVLFFGCLFVL